MPLARLVVKVFEPDGDSLRAWVVRLGGDLDNNVDGQQKLSTIAPAIEAGPRGRPRIWDWVAARLMANRPTSTPLIVILHDLDEAGEAFEPPEALAAGIHTAVSRATPVGNAVNPTEPHEPAAAVSARSVARWRVLAALAALASGAALTLSGAAIDVGPPRAEAFVATGPAPTDTNAVHGQKFRALLFAAHRYGPAFSDLHTPKNDIERIGELLEDRFGFDVTKYPNATRRQIIDALDGLAAESDDTAVIVYFAGHGVYKDRLKGFWIPSDATRSSATWVSNGDVMLRVQAALARHVLVISDSCFSAGLLRGDEASKDSGYPSTTLRTLAGRRSRVVMTSGGKQAVLDAGIGGMSVFAFRLQELLDSASGPYLVVPGDIFETLRRQVAEDTRNTTRQTPEVGRLPGAGHSGGEMVLVRIRGPDSPVTDAREHDRHAH